jgi:hypothetical protein
LTSETQATEANGRIAASSTAEGASLTLRVLRVVALALYTLAFAEVFIRVFAPQPIVPRYVTGMPWGIRGNIPNAHYWHYTPEVEVEYRINSQGMRADAEYPVAKPAGTCRIALFGDSFFVGYELALRDTYAIQLEQQLRAAGYRVELLNFSVSGFGTAEMIRTYEGFARQFDPDLVLFEWHQTDPDDNVRSGLYRLENGQLRSTGAAWLPGVKIQDFLLRFALYRLIADHSHLYSFAREQLAISLKSMLLEARNQLSSGPQAESAAEQAPGKSGQPLAEAARPVKRAAGAELSAALLLHAQDVVQREGRELYVIEVPRRISRTEFKSTLAVLPPHAVARLKVISPLASFEGAARPDLKLYYERGHGHFTPTAVQLLTRESLKVLHHSRRLAACRAGPSDAQ